MSKKRTHKKRKNAPRYYRRLFAKILVIFAFIEVISLVLCAIGIYDKRQMTNEDVTYLSATIEDIRCTPPAMPRYSPRLWIQGREYMTVSNFKGRIYAALEQEQEIVLIFKTESGILSGDTKLIVGIEGADGTEYLSLEESNAYNRRQTIAAVFCAVFMTGLFTLLLVLMKNTSPY